MATAYIVNPGTEHKKKKITIKKKKLKRNPTPLLVISNPKKSGGKKTMAKRKHAKKNARTRKVARKLNPVVNAKKRVHHRGKAKKVFQLNRKHRTTRAVAKRHSYKINARRHQHLRRNPDVMNSFGDYGSQVGLGLISAVATVMIPPMIYNAVSPGLATNKVALYAGEAVVFGGGAMIAKHLFKAHDWAGPIIFGGSIVLGLQIVADLFGAVQNYVNISGYRNVRASGYGQLPNAYNTGAIAYNAPSSVPNYAMSQMYA